MYYVSWHEASLPGWDSNFGRLSWDQLVTIKSTTCWVRLCILVGLRLAAPLRLPPLPWDWLIRFGMGGGGFSWVSLLASLFFMLQSQRRGFECHHEGVVYLASVGGDAWGFSEHFQIMMVAKLALQIVLWCALCFHYLFIDSVCPPISPPP